MKKLGNRSRICMELMLVIYSSFKVKNYFSLKCRTPLPLLANVVFKFQCPHEVDKVYIGKTLQHLATRVKKHAHPKGLSAIRDHGSSRVSCQSNYSISLFRLIDTARNDLGNTIKESLHSKCSKRSVELLYIDQVNNQILGSGILYSLQYCFMDVYHPIIRGEMHSQAYIQYC